MSSDSSIPISLAYNPALEPDILHLKAVYATHAEEFKSLFSLPLSRFWDEKTGFCLPAFFVWLRNHCKSGSTHAKQVISDTYGQEALDLVGCLILEKVL